MGNIIVSGEKFEVPANVICWNDPDGFCFEKNFNKHDYSLQEAKQNIKSFTLHHSVTFSAKETFDVLNSRSLSVNFIIDDDEYDGQASIYQCMDLVNSGWSQGEYNDVSRGCEISYRPDAWKYPELYKNKTSEHSVINDTVHGITRKVFTPSSAQMKAIILLLSSICSILDIEPQFPKTEAGEYIKTLIKNPKGWNGLLSHFNLSKDKIDPSGLDLSLVEKEIQNLFI